MILTPLRRERRREGSLAFMILRGMHTSPTAVPTRGSTIVGSQTFSGFHGRSPLFSATSTTISPASTNASRTRSWQSLFDAPDDPAGRYRHRRHGAHSANAARGIVSRNRFDSLDDDSDMNAVGPSPLELAAIQSQRKPPNNARRARRRSATDQSNQLAPAKCSSLMVASVEAVPSDVRAHAETQDANENGTSAGGWVRGSPAEVRWSVLDTSIQTVRLDVCNAKWDVPTTISTEASNDGTFLWKRVYWGMPITDGYYINVYDATEGKELRLLATSDYFRVVR